MPHPDPNAAAPNATAPAATTDDGARPPRVAPSDDGERLQKFLAAAGLGGRRECEGYIGEGRVFVNGTKVAEQGTRVAPDRDEVRVDGEVVRPQKLRYYLLNKPAGVLCTNRDPRGRPRAVDLVPDRDTRLFTVGRLDETSTGLLIVTNDGAFAQRLAHPRNQVVRRYRLQVAGVPSKETIASLRRGLRFSDGVFKLNTAKRLKTLGRSAFLEVELQQGRNREIRRLFARVGHKVMSLERVAFGPLTLGDLPLGKTRPLRREEIKALRTLTGNEQKPSAPRSRGGYGGALRGGRRPPRGGKPGRGPSDRGSKGRGSAGKDRRGGRRP